MFYHNILRRKIQQKIGKAIYTQARTFSDCRLCERML